jgi:hypothetical protein
MGPATIDLSGNRCPAAAKDEHVDDTVTTFAATVHPIEGIRRC